jgi:hypothetical protein
MYFSTLNPDVLLELSIVTHSLCDSFLKCNSSEFSLLSRYRYVSNMAEVLHYILNRAQSLTARLRSLKDVLTLKKQTKSKFCLRNTALLVVCRTAL